MTTIEAITSVQRKRSSSDATTVTLVETMDSSTSILLDSPPPLARNRVTEIEIAVRENDLSKLTDLAAEPGGFINSELRKLVW